jgi:hypothetical protein
LAKPTGIDRIYAVVLILIHDWLLLRVGCRHLFKGLVYQYVGRLRFVVAHLAASRGTLCYLVMSLGYHISISYGAREPKHFNFLCTLCSSSGPALTMQNTRLRLAPRRRPK